MLSYYCRFVVSFEIENRESPDFVLFCFMSTSQNQDPKAVDPEDDFKREMSLYVCF